MSRGFNGAERALNGAGRARSGAGRGHGHAQGSRSDSRAGASSGGPAVPSRFRPLRPPWAPVPLTGFRSSPRGFSIPQTPHRGSNSPHRGSNLHPGAFQTSRPLTEALNSVTSVEIFILGLFNPSNPSQELQFPSRG